MHWLLRLIGFYQPVRILRQGTSRIQVSRTFRLVLLKPRMLGRPSGFLLLGARICAVMLIDPADASQHQSATPTGGIFAVGAGHLDISPYKPLNAKSQG